jgi:cardiolipin synthase A/B
VPRFPLHLATIVGFALAVLLLALELRKRRAPAVTFAWLFAMALFPYVGVPLYFIFGGRKLSHRAASKTPVYAPRRVHQHVTNEAIAPLERLLDGMGVRPATQNNEIELLPTGESAYGALLELIGGAQGHIHVATFILAGDETGNTVVEHLTRRARDGLEVRLLVDGLFMFRTNRRALDELRRAGGKVAVFMPLVHLPFRGRSNLRNHRKIAVADGDRAIIGGMNIASEYMGPRPLEGRWRDVALRVKGSAARDLDELFRNDWAFASGEHLEAREPSASQGGGASARIVASGPDVETDTLYDAILFELFTAKERVLIATPYFVPDDAMVRALILACRRGIQVEVVLPTPSNHLMADLAGAPSLRTLESMGAKIRPYRAGMLHAKVIVVDRSLAAVGSANFDMRSLFLNYEVMALLYDEREVNLMADWFRVLAAKCDDRVPAVSRLRAAAEDVAHLFSPLA